jgi:uncharacterized protein YndB with AHSA1/START domain
MAVIDTTTNADDLTLTLVADFDAPPERVWTVWEDPRVLERWWGPPQWPASFTRHDFSVGGESRYHMTGPDGGTHHGYWVMSAIDRPHRIEFANGLAGADGEPVPGMPPATGEVTLVATDAGTRMTAVTRFASVAQMEMMLGMGMAEGMTAAVGQIDGLLEKSAS